MLHAERFQFPDRQSALQVRRLHRGKRRGTMRE
jgi:hypothetical protein